MEAANDPFFTIDPLPPKRKKCPRMKKIMDPRLQTPLNLAQEVALSLALDAQPLDEGDVSADGTQGCFQE